LGNLRLSEEAELSAVALKGILQYDSTLKIITAKVANGENQKLSNVGEYKNYIINGAFAINQRIAVALTTFTGSATVRQITIDRWGHTTGNITSPQFQQVDSSSAVETNLQARYYGLYKQITNSAKICVSQVLEGKSCLSLRGKRVRLSIKLKKTVGADKTICIGLVQLTSAGTIDTLPATFISAFNGAGVDPTFGTNLSLINPDSDKLRNATNGTTKLNCAITSVWQKFSGVFNLPTNFKNLVVVIFSNDVLAVNDDLAITECKLSLGTDDLEWEDEEFEHELLNCQRYFQKTFQYSVVPVQNAGLIGSAKGLVTFIGAVALASNIFHRFVNVMRIIPTITLFNPSVANASMRRYTATATDQTATVTANIGDGSLEITATGDALGVVGDKVAIHLTANAEL